MRSACDPNGCTPASAQPSKCRHLNTPPYRRLYSPKDDEQLRLGPHPVSQWAAVG
jgi:hypothetical protein